jgi:hypothetical protein
MRVILTLLIFAAPLAAAVIPAAPATLVLDGSIGRTYRSCGENSKSPPPKHPLLDPNH